MKKKFILTLSLTMIFLLTACNRGGANQVEEAQNPDIEQAGFQGEMPIESKLVFGSLMLEDTDLAITSDQAEELIPLWKLNKTLVESDTTAEAEMEAVMDSILAAMTEEQIAYIEALEIAPGDMFQLMEDLGIELGFRGGEGEDVDLPEGGRPGGGIPGQGTGGGQGPGGIQNLSPEQQETAQALREERGGGGRGFFGSPALIDALIELLESKT